MQLFEKNNKFVSLTIKNIWWYLTRTVFKSSNPNGLLISLIPCNQITLSEFNSKYKSF
jgi:hypothetical protein